MEHLIKFSKGNKPEQIERLLEKFKKTNLPIRILISGPTGCGKTYFMKSIAEHLDFNLVDVNVKESLDKIYSMTQVKTKPTIFLFDGADEIDDIKTLEKILTKSFYPVVLITDEEWKLQPSIRHRCDSYRAVQPKLVTIMIVIKQEAERNGMKPDYTRITAQDFRTAHNQAFYGSSPFEVRNKFERIKDVFTKKIVGDQEHSDLIWIIDNVNKFYHGRKMYEQIELVAEADRIKNYEILKYGHRSAKSYSSVETPYYTKRSKIFRRNGNWGGRG